MLKIELLFFFFVTCFKYNLHERLILKIIEIVLHFLFVKDGSF